MVSVVPEEAKKKPIRRKWRPLDVKTWFEGSLRLIGWILVIVLSVATGGVFICYELLYLNQHDVDFRDMYLDQRLTNYAHNAYHKNFLLAENCCNTDPLYFPYSCNEYFPDTYAIERPYCKPIIIIECTDIRSAACNSTRQVLYPALGMAIETRTYSNCLIAGRARVGAQPVSVGRPITLVAYYRNIPTGQTLVIQNPFNINVTEVNTYVESVIAGVDPAEVDYVQPPTRLSDGIVLDRSSVPAYQTTEHDNARGVKAPPPWNKVANLWPWPGMNGRCDNTAVNWTYMVEGAATIVIPRFSMADPAAAVIPFTVANTTVSVAAWQVQLANPSDTTGGSMFVSVSYLTGLQVRIGQVPLLGQCNGWQFSPDEFDWTLDYTTYWSGNLSDLEAGATFGPFVQLVTVAVKDVGANQYFELPFYGGMWYIWNAFLMAFFWLVSNSLMLFIIILVWWNVRSNKGLPPIIYRYMQKYRGW